MDLSYFKCRMQTHVNSYFTIGICSKFNEIPFWNFQINFGWSEFFWWRIFLPEHSTLLSGVKKVKIWSDHKWDKAWLHYGKRQRYMASLSTAVTFQLNQNNTTKLNHCHDTATCFTSAGKSGDCFCTIGYSTRAHNFYDLCSSWVQEIEEIALMSQSVRPTNHQSTKQYRCMVLWSF